MFEYKITDEGRWDIEKKVFEKSLKNLYPEVIIGCPVQIGRTEMVAYGINEDKKRIGRLDVSYRTSGTIVHISGEEAEGLSKKLTEETDFIWVGGEINPE